jgi:hypothetical protein
MDKIAEDTIAEDTIAEHTDPITLDSAKPKKKGIQWHSRNSIDQVKRISTFNNYSEEEMFAVWGDDEEASLRKSELVADVMDMKKSKRVSDNFHTSLGLTGHIGDGKKEKKLMRLTGRAAVMDEQALQDEEGFLDDEILADVYYMTTHGAQEKAHQEAMKIHEEVEKLSLEESGSNNDDDKYEDVSFKRG